MLINHRWTVTIIGLLLETADAARFESGKVRHKDFLILHLSHGTLFI